MVKYMIVPPPTPTKYINLVLLLLFLCKITSSQTIYIGALGHGVYKSMGDARTWFSVNENLPNLNVEYLIGVKYIVDDCLCYDLYASTAAGLYRTTDGGITWHLIFNELPYAGRVKISPDDYSTIYIGHHLLYRSTDYGHTWIDITPPADAGHGMAFDIDPEDRNVIYAFGINTYYIPWPFTFYDLYRSVDKGNHWVMHSQWVQPFTGGYTIDQLKIDPQTSQRMYYNEQAVTGSVFKSSDWGMTWSSCQNPVFARTFLIDSLYPNILYIGLRKNGIPGMLGVHKSVDYGNSWTPTGLSTCNIRALAQDIINDTKIYAGGDVNENTVLYISTNGGSEWTLFTDNLPYQSTVSTINPTDFLKESYPSMATAFSACKMIYSQHSNNIWFSYNGHNRIINCQAVDIMGS